MGKAIPTQHPAVVLRSQFQLVRTLLAVAMIAVVALTAAVVILANEEDQITSAGSATQVITPSTTGPNGSTRYDGGPEEGTRGAIPAPQPGVRYDGGPEEGTRGTIATPQAPDTRYDGGPDEGTRGPGH